MPSNLPSDATQMLLAVASDEPEALHRLYEAQASRLFGIAMAILRDRDAAADALHDAVVKVASHARQFDPVKGEGAAWLSAIVRHTALDHARARGRETPAGDLVLAEDVMAPEALDHFAEAETSRHLQDCLAALDVNKRRAILLAFTHGLSHAQVAAQLSLPLGTVKSWIRRGLAWLKECIA